MSEEVYSYEKFNNQQLQELNKYLSNKDTLEVIKWAYQHFGDDLVYACSFGAEGVVLVDLISKVKKNARIVFLDTHVHFKETYELIDRIKAKYPSLIIDMIQPEQTLEEQARDHGPELWKSNPNLCCRLRKIIPLEKALTGARAWMSGLRREQSATRAHVQYVNRDEKFKSLKICPLILWTWEDIWNYIRAFDIPYNELHDKGYPSIGCETCTLPVADGRADTRAGRWANSDKTECGLHQ